MANVKISELAESDVLVGDEILPIVQGGITKKVTVSQIVDNVDSYTKSESDVIFDTKVDKVTGSSLVEDTKVTAYDNHIADTSNPHGVTASQVGAYTTSQSDTLLNAKEDTANKGTPDGYASLDSNGKVPLTQISDSILGQLEYMGVWDFTTLPTATQKGQYWVASGSGNGYEVGDWAVYNGTTFDKVDNTDAVSSVAGRTGNVVLTKNDVGLSNVTNDVQEPTANKKTNIETNKTSDTFFPTIKAVYDWAMGLFNTKVTKVTSTDNAIVRFNGTTGDVQNSGVVVDDSGNLIAPTGIFTEQRDETGPAGVVIDFPNYSGTDGRIISRDTNTTAYKNLQIGALNTSFVNGGFERMRIDSAGNLGIGVTPSAWSSPHIAQHIGMGAVLAGYGTTNWCSFISNAYNSSGWKYRNNGYASKYDQLNGNHSWYTAPSGTAGDPITWTSAMTLDSAGNVGIGTTTPTERLHINGNIKYGSYGMFIGSGNNNTTQIVFNVDSHNTTDNTYTPIYSGGSNAGMSVIRMSGGGVGGLDFYTRRSGTNATAQNLSIFNKTLSLTDTGYVRIGQDAPAIRHKKLTGTTASTEGGSVTVAHGLTGAKIISATCLVRHQTNGGIVPESTSIGAAGYQYGFVVDGNGTDVRVLNHPTNSENILSKPFTILITYEE